MAKIENGVFQFQLRNPLLAHADQPVQRMLFEARLVRLLLDQGNAPDAAIAEMQALIEHWAPQDGVAIAKASQCVVQGPVLKGASVPFVRDIFRTVNDPDRREQITGTKWDNTIGTLMRPYKFTPNMYDSLAVSTLWYFVRGNIKEIHKILTTGSRRIGPLRAKGGAEIATIEMDILPKRAPMFGILCGGKLMRPVPARIEDALTALGEVDYINGMVENWQIPFHELSTKELCLVPVQTCKHMVMSLDQIRGLA